MMFYAKLMIPMVLLSVMLVGCQSQPNRNTQGSQTSKPLPVVVLPAPVMTTPAQPLLVGSVWMIRSIKGKPAQAYTQQPLMKFNERAQVSGSTGCNTLYGEYSLGLSGELSVRIGISRSICAGALAQEADLIDAFDRTRRYELQGKQLLLKDERGQVMIQAQAQ